MTQFTVFTIPFAAIGLLVAAMAVAAWRRRNAPAAGPAATLLGALAAWTLLNTVEKSLTLHEARYAISTAQYLFIVMIPAAWFVFGARFAGVQGWPPRRLLPLLAIEPIIAVSLAFTDPLHGLVRSETTMRSAFGMATMAVTYGPAFWIHAVYSYLVYFAGAALIVKGFLHKPGYHPGKLAAVLAAMIAPAIGNALYVLGWQPIPDVNLTPLYVTITGCAVLWLLFDARLFDVRPIGRDLVLDQLADAVYVLDRRGCVVDANRSALAIVGDSREELIGRPLAAALTPLAPLIEASAEERPVAGEIELLVGSERRNMSVSVSQLSEAGATLGKAVQLCDITEARRAENERRRLDEAVRGAQKLESLAALAGGVAHDLNNLLSVILGNMELARMDLPPGAGVDHFLARGVRAAESAAGVANQLLAYAGRGRVKPEPIALKSLLERMNDLLRAAVNKPGTLELDLAAEPLWVAGDASQLRQMIVNLVSNASDSLPPIGGTVSVRTRLVQVVAEDLKFAAFNADLKPGEQVLIEVSDTGVGIEPGELSRVFDPFYSTKFAGRGLGLAVALGIVRAHRGAIFLESEPLLGTQVKVVLPRIAPPEESSKVAASEGGAARPLGVATILLVDDEPAVLDVAGRILERAGFVVASATNGADALDLLRKSRRIDLVALDLVMPGTRIDETLRQVRAHSPGLPILLLSGFDRDRALEGLNPSPPFAFLAKPYRVDELIDSVRRLLAVSPDLVERID